jgi:hypothetical protein
VVEVARQGKKLLREEQAEPVAAVAVAVVSDISSFPHQFWVVPKL